MSADEIIVGSKRCAKCGETKAVSAFGRDSTRKDGLRSQCKECVREYNRVYREANPEKVRERKRVYYAANSEKVNEKSRVYRAANPEKLRERDRVYYAANPEKVREKNRVYREANPEKLRERKRVYYAANPEKGRVNGQRRRSRKANLPNTLTTAEWYYAIDYFHGYCAVCDRPLKDLFVTHTASADHWIPLTKGGGTTADNIVPLCSGEDGCNNSKHNAMPEVWLALKFGKRKARVILQRINAYFELVKAKDKEVA